MKTFNFCGKSVPRVGLGCMGMSEFYGKSDDRKSLDLLLEAFDLGYRHFDTADMYGRGHNEELLARFLSKLGSRAREDIVLASKVGIVRHPEDKYRFSIDNSYDYIKRACEESLRRLGVDRIDLYYLHRLAPGHEVPDALRAFSDLLREGKIGAVGLCEVSAEILEKAVSVQPISAIQSEYSLWSRDVEQSILPVCERLDISLVAYCPLGRGFLAGEVTTDSMAEASTSDDLRTRLPRFTGDNFEKNIRLIERLEDISQSVGVTKSNLSLAWLLHQSEKVHVIPGTRRSAYLQENFSARSLQLPREVYEALSEVFQPGAVSGARYPTASQ